MSARQQWLDELHSAGASLDTAGGGLRWPDDAGADAEGVAALPELGVLRVRGRDARKFLHAQVSCDVLNLAVGASSLGAWCDNKGRIQALLRLIAAQDEDIFALAPVGVLDAVEARMRMFLLRSRASLERADDSHVCLGILGRGAAAASGLVPEVSATATEAAQDVSAVNLSAGRWLAVGSPEALRAPWQKVCDAGFARHDENIWGLLQVRAGEPQVWPATMGEFVPQMVNLELIGGVSFSKGCYPGQEIVARTQYRGRIKRRMYLGRMPGNLLPGAGDVIHDDAERALGMVVQAAWAGTDSVELLAVLRSEAVDSGARLQLVAEGGGTTTVTLGTLPYALTPDAA